MRTVTNCIFCVDEISFQTSARELAGKKVPKKFASPKIFKATPSRRWSSFSPHAHTSTSMKTYGTPQALRLNRGSSIREYSVPRIDFLEPIKSPLSSSTILDSPGSDDLINEITRSLSLSEDSQKKLREFDTLSEKQRQIFLAALLLKLKENELDVSSRKKVKDRSSFWIIPDNLDLKTSITKKILTMRDVKFKVKKKEVNKLKNLLISIGCIESDIDTADTQDNTVEEKEVFRLLSEIRSSVKKIVSSVADGNETNEALSLALKLSEQFRVKNSNRLLDLCEIIISVYKENSGRSFWDRVDCQRLGLGCPSGSESSPRKRSFPEESLSSMEPEYIRNPKKRRRKEKIRSRSISL